MSKEAKVGILAAVAGVLLYFGFNFLKGNDLFSGKQTFYVEYPKVDQLTKSNPVVVNGVSVGKVKSIRLNQVKHNVLVELEIKEDFIVGNGAIANLVNSDFLGGKAIELKTGDLARPLVSGDTLEAQINDALTDALESAGSVADDVGVTITRVNEILAGMKGSGEHLAASIEGMEETIGKVNYLLAANSEGLRITIANAARMSSKLDSKLDQLDPIIGNAKNFSRDLSQLELQTTLDKTNALLDDLSTTIGTFKNSEGTLGRMVNDDSVYVNLNQLLVDMSKLVNHLNEHPKDFFSPFGKKHKKVKENID